MKKTLLTLAVTLFVYYSYAQTYLPLTAGSGSPLSGNLYLNASTGNFTAFQTAGSNTALLGNSAIIFGSGSSTNFNTYVYGNNPYNIWTNSAQRLTVDGSGNVGIGTTSPSTNLEVSSSSGATELRIATTSGTYNNPSLTFYSSYTSDKNWGFRTSVYTLGDFSLFQSASSGSSPFSGGADRFYIGSTGNVGIGTTSPSAKLEVYGGGIKVNGLSTSSTVLDLSAVDDAIIQGGTNTQIRMGGNLNLSAANVIPFSTNASERMRLQSSGGLSFGSSYVSTDPGANNIIISGNVGVGTTSPASVLDAEGSSTTEWVRIQSNASGSAGFLDLYSSATGGFDAGTVGLNTNGTTPIAFNIGGSETMRMVTGGNLLIGKTSQANTSYKLDINGNARANEIVVNTTGADFVFKKNYRLSKLEEIEVYVKKNHHLANIPTADAMNENGMAVGELNTKLLQKVEELTLYLIEQNKQLTNQQKSNQEQKKKLEQQETRIAALEKTLSKLAGNK